VILILAFLFCIAFKSEANEALRLADALFNLQSYDESITEYKRFLFFNPDDERAGYGYYRIGLAYRAERNWEKAVDALKTSIKLTDNDKLRDERTIELGITLIASGNYSFAQMELLKVSEFSQYQFLKKKASHFQGVAYLYMYNWEGARRAFDTFYSHSSEQRRSEKAKNIDALLIEAQHLPYKSVTIAKTLSAFLPGTGQIYASNWRNGLNAMLINSLTAGLLLNAVMEKQYQDAALIFLLLFQRYYLGNRYQAAERIKEYNDTLNRQHAVKILQILLDE
jgi:tetratricopeptide (TPR) repeat protein